MTEMSELYIAIVSDIGEKHHKICLRWFMKHVWPSRGVLHGAGCIGKGETDTLVFVLKLRIQWLLFLVKQLENFYINTCHSNEVFQLLTNVSQCRVMIDLPAMSLFLDSKSKLESSRMSDSSNCIRTRLLPQIFLAHACSSWKNTDRQRHSSIACFCWNKLQCLNFSKFSKALWKRSQQCSLHLHQEFQLLKQTDILSFRCGTNVSISSLWHRKTPLGGSHPKNCTQGCIVERWCESEIARRWANLEQSTGILRVLKTVIEAAYSRSKSICYQHWHKTTKHWLVS